MSRNLCLPFLARTVLLRAGAEQLDAGQEQLGRTSWAVAAGLGEQAREWGKLTWPLGQGKRLDRGEGQVCRASKDAQAWSQEDHPPLPSHLAGRLPPPTSSPWVGCAGSAPPSPVRPSRGAGARLWAEGGHFHVPPQPESCACLAPSSLTATPTSCQQVLSLLPVKSTSGLCDFFFFFFFLMKEEKK